jgi:hypothetical protein
VSGETGARSPSPIIFHGFKAASPLLNINLTTSHRNLGVTLLPVPPKRLLSPKLVFSIFQRKTMGEGLNPRQKAAPRTSKLAMDGEGIHALPRHGFMEILLFSITLTSL